MITKIRAFLNSVGIRATETEITFNKPVSFAEAPSFPAATTFETATTFEEDVTFEGNATFGSFELSPKLAAVTDADAASMASNASTINAIIDRLEAAGIITSNT